MRNTCLLVLLAAWPTLQEEQKSYAEYKMSTLQRMLAVRGVQCEGCESRADWVAKVEGSAHLPVRIHLEEAYERRAEYKKNVDTYNMTKDAFIRQMNETEADIELEGTRADRLWLTYQQQMRDGEVTFVDGVVRFTLPITHVLGKYLAPSVCDALEKVLEMTQSVYSFIPVEFRREIAIMSLYLYETQVLHLIIICLGALLLIDFLFSLCRKTTKVATKQD